MEPSAQRICIIGLNASNLILGFKLARCGISVKLIDSSCEKIEKFKAGVIPDIIKQGAFLLNEPESRTLKNILSLYVRSI